MSATHRELEERYRPLRLYSGIAFAVGWLIIVLGIIGAIAGIVMAVISDDRLGLDRPVLVLASVGIVLLLGLAGLRLLAFSDLIFLFIDLEENTRHAASRLSDIMEQTEDKKDS